MRLSNIDRELYQSNQFTNYSINNYLFEEIQIHDTAVTNCDA